MGWNILDTIEANEELFNAVVKAAGGVDKYNKQVELLKDAEGENSYDAGYDAGYDEGHDEGHKEVKTNIISDLIPAVAEVIQKEIDYFDFTLDNLDKTAAGKEIKKEVEDFLETWKNKQE